MRTSVYISRHATEVTSLISSLIHAGFQVQAQSLISTSPVEFPQPIPKTDWIFFSSGNSVRYFFSQIKKTPVAKYAAIGMGTARELSQFVRPDFTGSSIDILETARIFAKHAGPASVLFPGAENSLKHVQSVFLEKQIQNLICYRTEETPVHVGYPDILVFSSPSNVRSFFRINRMFTYQQSIAFGLSTANELKKYGASSVSIPRSLSDEDILEAIKQVADS